MLDRVLELEVMDSPQDAADYDAMDHAEVNRVFVADFLSAVPTGALDGGEVLDVGAGTAQIPIALCGRAGGLRLVAIDLADSMLELGQRNVARASLADRIRLERADAKQLPYATGRFAAVISNSIVHHIPQPEAALREMIRVTTPGGSIFVRDLARPADEATLNRLVAAYAAGANTHQRQLFADSLRAALTVEEVQSLVQACGFSAAGVSLSSDRHWTWHASK